MWLIWLRSQRIEPERRGGVVPTFMDVHEGMHVTRTNSPRPQEVAVSSPITVRSRRALSAQSQAMSWPPQLGHRSASHPKWCTPPAWTPQSWQRPALVLLCGMRL